MASDSPSKDALFLPLPRDSDLTEEELESHFLKRDNGGNGEVAVFRIDDGALLQFDSMEAATAVLKKKQVIREDAGGIQLHLKRHFRGSTACEVGIINLPSEEDLMALGRDRSFFDDNLIALDAEEVPPILLFRTEAAANGALAAKLTVNGKQLEFQRYCIIPDDTRTLVVSQLPPSGKVTAETLQAHFQRISNGGDGQDVFVEFPQGNCQIAELAFSSPAVKRDVQAKSPHTVAKSDGLGGKQTWSVRVEPVETEGFTQVTAAINPRKLRKSAGAIRAELCRQFGVTLLMEGDTVLVRGSLKNVNDVASFLDKTSLLGDQEFGSCFEGLTKEASTDSQSRQDQGSSSAAPAAKSSAPQTTVAARLLDSQHDALQNRKSEVLEVQMTTTADRKEENPVASSEISAQAAQRQGGSREAAAAGSVKIMTGLNPTIVELMIKIHGPGFGQVDPKAVQLDWKNNGATMSVSLPREAVGEFINLYEYLIRNKREATLTAEFLCRYNVHRVIERHSKRNPGLAIRLIGNEVKVAGDQDQIDRSVGPLEHDLMQGDCARDCECKRGGNPATVDQSSGSAAAVMDAKAGDILSDLSTGHVRPSQCMLKEMSDGLFEVIEGVKIFAYKGNLSSLHVDAVVNPTNSKFEMTRGLGAALLEGAGSGLKKACDKALARKLSYEFVTTTEGFNLPCKQIIHMIVRRDTDLRLQIVEAINAAAQNGVESLGIPAIGSGGGEVSSRQSSLAILQALKLELRPGIKHTIKHVHLVDIEAEKVEQFRAGLRVWMRNGSIPDK